MTLTEFLTARLDEDEAAAREPSNAWSTAYDACATPSRVLREVAAKRAIMALWPTWPGVPGSPARTTHCYLAAVYADHPDYDPEWKP